MNGETIDTLRIVVSWRCNFACPYCCNEIPRFRSQFTPVPLASIDFHKYTTICLSGGEPLLDLPTLKNVLIRIPTGKKVVLYTNGTLLTRETASLLAQWGVQYINVGLHTPQSSNTLIAKGLDAVKDTPIKIRFHAQDIYQEVLTDKYNPEVSYFQYADPKEFEGDRKYVLALGVPVFRFWKMDDCDRGNEDRVVLSS